jgi:microcystin-dependent protein
MAATIPPAFIGEVRIFCGNFAPAGWLACDGQLVAIATYSDLFSMIGTTYGGDGMTTFAVPDLRGRVPIQPGQGPGLSYRALADSGGFESHTLGITELPAHSHTLRASSAAGAFDAPAGHVPARSLAAIPEFGPAADTDLGTGAVGSTGGGLAHNNMQPFQVLNYIIAFQGDVPTP